MAHFAGLDVATAETAVCVVDADGAVVLETKVETDPAAIGAVLAPFAATLSRVGHEAGSLAAWLQVGLTEAGFPIHCLETRHVRAALDAQRNKTDRHDALGIAQLMRTGWFRAVHVKSADSHRLRVLLANRRTLKRKCLDLENAVRHSLKAFGVKIGAGTGRARFADAVRAGVDGDPVLTGLCEAMLRARAALWGEYARLHTLVTQLTTRDEVCRRFMEIPGVGPVTALSFKAAVDDPARFGKSRNVGAHFGLTAKRWQSGTSIDAQGRISKQGDPDVRTVLYEAASCLLTRSKTACTLRTWGKRIEKRAGHRKAVVAVARRLAVIMHAMWRDGTYFDFGEAGRRPRPDARSHPVTPKVLAAPVRVSA